MRIAPAERQVAEIALYKEGWTVVKLPRDFMPVPRDFMLAENNTPALMMKWCEDNIGAGRVEPGCNWLDGRDVWYMFTWYGYWNFHFKHAKDATAFSLRWA